MNDISVAWLHDCEEITAIVNSPDIAPFVLEGEAFSAPTSSAFIKYIGVYKSNNLVGVYIFNRRLKHMWEVHTCLTSACRGKSALIAGKLAMALLFSALDITCLTTFVPAPFLHVQAYTTRMGFTLTGVLPNCFYYKGVVDCYLYAITKEEVLLCLQQQ